MDPEWGPLLGDISMTFPPAPTFTEKNLGDLSGQVVVVTGGASGIGEAFCKLVYAANATVWIAGRSAENAAKSIASIQAAHPSAKGELHFLELDLSDLSSVAEAVKTFTAAASRLDILVNNAGVSSTPVGAVTKQGYELVWGTNVLGHHYWTRLLLPLLEKTAGEAKSAGRPESPRIVWVSSLAALSTQAPSPGGIYWDDLAFENHNLGPLRIAPYAQSKAANIFQAAEFARRLRERSSESSIISISLHPGGLRTNIGRHVEGWMVWAMKKFLFHEPIMGAYTILFAAFSPEVTSKHNGKFVTAWGRFADIRPDLKAEIMKGENGNGSKLWDWCETEIAKCGLP